MKYGINNDNEKMRVKVVKRLRPGHEYMPNPKSINEFRESYEVTGGRTGGEDGKEQYFLYRMMMLEGEGNEEMSKENGKRGPRAWRNWKSDHMIRQLTRLSGRRTRPLGGVPGGRV